VNFISVAPLFVLLASICPWCLAVGNTAAKKSCVLCYQLWLARHACRCEADRWPKDSGQKQSNCLTVIKPLIMNTISDFFRKKSDKARALLDDQKGKKKISTTQYVFTTVQR